MNTTSNNYNKKKYNNTTTTIAYGKVLKILVVIAFVLGTNNNYNVTATTTVPTKDQYLVEGLADIEPAFKSYHGLMYAGLIPTTLLSDLNNDDDDNNNDTYSNHSNTNNTTIGKLMFWYFDPHEPYVDDTIVIWMNGGPGCSSLAGCLFEHGPVTIPLHEAGYYGTQNDNKTLIPNNYSWTNSTRMLYVEQPIGVGFGIGGTDPVNEIDVGYDFYIFLQNFYSIFPDLVSKKLYLFGESYAGMYVPSIAYYIHERNVEYNTTTPPQSQSTSTTTTTTSGRRMLPIIINLAGIGVGNGWMDVMIQGPTVIDYLWWHGMIDMYTAHELHRSWANCIGGAPQHYPFHPFTTPDECGIANVALLSAGDKVVSFGSPNVYDVTTFDEYVTISGDDGAISKFYNNPKVQDALHVGQHRTWKSCTGNEHGRALLHNDRPLSMLPYLSKLLDDAQINVLIYNGDRDLLANQPGSELTLSKLDWSGAKGWADVDLFNRSLYIDSPNSIGGYIKSYKNLHLLSVYNSGHMVPYNRPILALDLITRYISGRTLHDIPLPNHKAKVYERSNILPDKNEYKNGNGAEEEEKEDGIIINEEEEDDDDDEDIGMTYDVDNGTMKETFTRKLIHNPFFVWFIIPLIFVSGVIFGICIARRQHRKYEGYDEIPPVPVGSRRRDRI